MHYDLLKDDYDRVVAVDCNFSTTPDEETMLSIGFIYVEVMTPETIAIKNQAGDCFELSLPSNLTQQPTPRVGSRMLFKQSDNSTRFSIVEPKQD